MMQTRVLKWLPQPQGRGSADGEDRTSEVLKSLHGFNSRVQTLEEENRERKDRPIENILPEEEETRLEENKQSFRHLWDDTAQNNVHTSGVWEGEGRTGQKKEFEHVIS